MTNEIKENLNQILDSISTIEESIQGIGFDDYHTDRRRKILAVECFENIISLMHNIPEDFKANSTDIEWAEIAGLRKLFVNHEFGINEHEIWNASKKTIRRLKKQVLNHIQDRIKIE